MRRSIAFALAVLLVAPGVARAQSSPSLSRHTPAWIAVGIGTGFGVGLWTGLTAFDDSTNSDRKVWTTAVVSASAGGLLALLLTREKRAAHRATGATGPTGATGAAGATGATRCVRCSVYSLRSPASGDSLEALAAGR
jgi:hypothetical protein